MFEKELSYLHENVYKICIFGFFVVLLCKIYLASLTARIPEKRKIPNLCSNDCYYRADCC